MRGKLYNIPQEITLKDGTVIFVREVRKEDLEELKKLYSSLSRESLYLRFFGKPSSNFIEKYVERAVNVDRKNSFGIVAFYGNDLVAHSEYYATSRDSAEVAFTVSDNFHGRGVGTALLGVMAEIAWKNGIKEFYAMVLPENYQMIKVFRDSGFPVRVRPEIGALVVRMPTAITEEVLEHFERREKLAIINALRRFFCPNTIAVIGASKDRKKVGGKLLYNILVYGYNGTVYPVNKNSKYSQSVRCYPSISDVPDEVDLAIVAVPFYEVLNVAEECGKKGVKALLVITSGFAELGGEGKNRQEELLKICRKYGMRLIGPNCMGIVNTDPNLRLNATFAPNPPQNGRIGFASQSGAVGLAVMDHASSYGLGLSFFASLGNRADISSNDLIEYWEEDPRTDLILLYLESFGNPRKFARIAKRVSKKKPILALASGITPVGTNTASIIGSLISSSGIVVESFFKQTGIIRADTLDQLFAISCFLLHQPLPRGRKVCILTNGGGYGDITADWCKKVGLKIPELSQETKMRLLQTLPPISSVQNPVDMTASANFENYSDAIKIVSKDENVDAIVVIFVQAVSMEETSRVVESVLEASRYANSLGKPVIFIYAGTDLQCRVLRKEDLAVPVYVDPSLAAEVLSKVAEYSEWKMKPKEDTREFEVNRDKAAAIIAKSLGKKEWLNILDSFELLNCYGIKTPDYVYLKPEELKDEKAIEKVEKLGVVSVKAVAEKPSYGRDPRFSKSGVYGAEAIRAAKEILQELKEVDGFIFQKIVHGIEMFIGVVEDQNFGPLIACGAGGEFAELLKDISVKVTPITYSEGLEMVKSLRIYPMLEGYKGREAVNIESFVETILRINMLIEDFPEIVEVECNPVVLDKSSAVVFDASVRLRV
ncbi:MAG: GNAT family N-acetyltransferase [Archaeoglobales archaeon]|nr:GNAT family N-acetyltransferase [Archaeoglobales archaeon]